MTGVAVKETIVPGHTSRLGVLMVTPAVRTVFTVIVTALEVAGFPWAHCSDEFITQVTISPLSGA